MRLNFLSELSPASSTSKMVSESRGVGALRWIQHTGGSFVRLSYDAELIATSAPRERRHAERSRAQALAQVTGGALAISRHLVASKKCYRSKNMTPLSVTKRAPLGASWGLLAEWRYRSEQVRGECLLLCSLTARETRSEFEDSPFERQRPSRGGGSAQADCPMLQGHGTQRRHISILPTL